MPPQQPRQREQVANNEIHKRPEQAALPRPRQQRAEPSEPSAPREPRTSLRTLRVVDALVTKGESQELADWLATTGSRLLDVAELAGAAHSAQTITGSADAWIPVAPRRSTRERRQVLTHDEGERIRFLLVALDRPDLFLSHQRKDADHVGCARGICNSECERPSSA